MWKLGVFFTSAFLINFLLSSCAEKQPQNSIALSLLPRAVTHRDSDQAVVISPLPASFGITFPLFVYPVPLTNGFLESSTDLVHWEERDDFIVTNGEWLVKMDPSKPREFYRVGGEPLP
jgi:hypothetical protein